MAGLLTGSSFPMPSRVLVMWSQAVAIGTYRKFYRSFTAAGLSGICTRFPFHSSSTPGKESTKPAAKITLLSEKPPEIADYFHQPQPESAGKDPIPACASTRKNIPNITLMYQIRIQSFLHIYFPFCSCRIFVNFAAIIFSH